MKKEELRADIEEMLLDIEFSYKGIDGSICPFSRENIAVKYGENESVLHSVDALMCEPFIDGQTLNEVCEELSFY